MDVASDISVLRTLLAREGLTKGAFDKKEKKVMTLCTDKTCAAAET